jgi:rhodanese-related sulfurtransferase
MSENPLDLQTAREHAVKTQESLDRKVFFLKALSETSRELSGLTQPKRILDTFLLMTMGPFGITHGLIALFSTKTGQGNVTGRGISMSDSDEVTRSLPLINARYFPLEKSPEGSPSRVKFLTKESLSFQDLFPAEIHVLVFWALSDDHSGFLGLGEKMSGQPFDEGDTDLLLNLTNVLTNALSHALSIISTQQLNAALSKKNTELEDALEELKRSRDELDRRIFHLQSLSDLNAELSPMFDLDGLLRAFILTIMGSLGVKQGFVLVFDREARLAKVASRGLDSQPTVDGDVCEKLLFRAFDSLQNKSLTPMSLSRIVDSAFLNQAGIDIGAAFGAFFLIDPSYMGMVVLGQTIKGHTVSSEEEDLLATQTSSFMVFLKNARAFQSIRALNEDLTTRNEELRRTIEELTEAKQTISLLEKARGHMRSLIQKEAERVGRARTLDFALIFLLAMFIGVLFNFGNPQGVPLVQEPALRPSTASVDPWEARRMIEEAKAVLVDARPKELYDQKHIEGAANVPLALFDVVHMMKLNNLDPEIPVIVYGRNISRLYDEELAFRLKQRDHDHVVILSGGLDAWEARGYPVQ